MKKNQTKKLSETKKITEINKSKELEGKSWGEPPIKGTRNKDYKKEKKR